MKWYQENENGIGEIDIIRIGADVGGIRIATMKAFVIAAVVIVGTEDIKEDGGKEMPSPKSLIEF